jgi:hypothetical protein
VKGRQHREAELLGEAAHAGGDARLRWTEQQDVAAKSPAGEQAQDLVGLRLLDR